MTLSQKDLASINFFVISPKGFQETEEVLQPEANSSRDPDSDGSSSVLRNVQQLPGAQRHPDLHGGQAPVPPPGLSVQGQAGEDPY